MSATRRRSAANPWERWGWAFASIWLVFLVYPVIATVEADVPVAAKVADPRCASSASR